MEQVANIDHESILHGGNRDPGASWRIENLQTRLSGILEKEGDAAKVGVGAG
jgi:hypothetical protein